MFPVLLALAAEASAATHASPVGGSLTSIFSADDYPADALDLNQQGSVGVLVRVDPKGAVSDCIVTASSGSPGLDAQTCRIVWLRAKFTPARDPSGKAIPSLYQQSIVWRIAAGDSEDDSGSSDPFMVRWIVSGWDNDLPSCRSELGGTAEGEYAGPAPCPAYIAGIPGSLGDVVNPYDQIAVQQNYSVGQAPAVALAPAERLIGRELARLDIDEAGRVLSCKVVDVAGNMPPQLSRACLIGMKHYLPKKNASGSPVPFTAYYLTELYGHTAAVR